MEKDSYYAILYYQKPIFYNVSRRRYNYTIILNIGEALKIIRFKPGRTWPECLKFGLNYVIKSRCFGRSVPYMFCWLQCFLC